MKIEEKIDELMEELQADDYAESVAWNGYKVFVPEYEDNPCIGLPYVVLVKGEEVRISTPEEAIDYLNYESTQKDQEKTIEELEQEQQTKI